VLKRKENSSWGLHQLVKVRLCYHKMNVSLELVQEFQPDSLSIGCETSFSSLSLTLSLSPSHSNLSSFHSLSLSPKGEREREEREGEDQGGKEKGKGGRGRDLTLHTFFDEKNGFLLSLRTDSPMSNYC